MGAGLSNGVTNLVEMGVGREDTQLQPSLVCTEIRFGLRSHLMSLVLSQKVVAGAPAGMSHKTCPLARMPQRKREQCVSLDQCVL